ncbi:MAG: methyl-accepting chemotaxis protein [Clostridia bacterium]|nr:methyl-accepting chemotaxis protein [Clostridia bacterium]
MKALSFLKSKGTSILGKKPENRMQKNKWLGKAMDILKHIVKLSSFLRNTKIQTRLMVSFLVLTIFPLLITGMVSYQRSSSAVESKIKAYSSVLMKEVGNNIEIQMDKYMNVTNEIMLDKVVQSNLPEFAKMDDIDRFEKVREIEALLSSRCVFLKGVSTVAVVSSDRFKFFYGQTIGVDDTFMDGLIKELEGSKEKYLWTYRKIGNLDNAIFIKEIKSTNSATALGYIVMAVQQDFICNMYRELQLGDNSHIFIVNNNGVIVSSKDAKEIGTKVSDTSLMKNLSANQGSFNSGSTLAAYNKMSNLNWFIVGKIPFNYLYSESRDIRFVITIIIVICILFALLLSFIISRSISAPLMNLVKYMKEAKAGNLIIDVKDTKTDEIAEVTNNFHDMLFNIRNLITQVHGSAQNVLVNSDRIASAADQSYRVSEQMAATILQIAQGASSQAADIADGVNNMGNLSEDINSVVNHMDTVTNVVKNTKAMSNHMQDAVNLLNDKALETNQVSEKIVNDIYSLNDYMKEIKGIIKMIVAIAEQTNLLSLNAAIEAARAGEAGRGFAVVAEEVRKLADQSKDATVTINNIINKIQAKTELTVHEAGNASSIIKQQMQAVHEADDAFKTIFKAMDNISTRMEEVSLSINKIVSSKNKTMEIMENISAVSEEAAATAEEVSASTQEQINSAEDLSKSAKELSEMADELDKAISIFKIE